MQFDPLPSKLYSIDPNYEVSNARLVYSIPGNVSILTSDTIFYDTENVYFQDNHEGNYIHKVKISDGSSKIVLQNTKFAMGFALNNSISSGIYFNQPNNLDKLQYFDFRTGLSEILFRHKCELNSHPRIILNSNDGSKLFYMCISSNSFRLTNSVFIYDLRNSDNQGLQSFELFNDESFILSPDDKYVIVFSDFYAHVKIVGMKKYTAGLEFKNTLKSIDSKKVTRKLFFSKNGKYLYILENDSSTEISCIFHEIDFAHLSRDLEAENVTSKSSRSFYDYKLRTEIINIRE